MKGFHGTTIVCVRKNSKLALGGDGQVTLGDTSIKHSAKKVQKIYEDKVTIGFAGSTADAMTLFDKFEAKLQEFGGNLKRSAVELGKDWRTDKVLRRLEALLIVADRQNMFLISGSGDVIEPDEDVLAIGSGGAYAKAAAKALLQFSDLEAEEVVRNSLEIASEICIYTNSNITIEVI